VSYEDVNVLADPSARDELIRLTGRTTIPVIVVDDEVVVGFDRAKLESLLTI
jgi:glutaredoxin 3